MLSLIKLNKQIIKKNFIFMLL